MEFCCSFIKYRYRAQYEITTFSAASCNLKCKNKKNCVIYGKSRNFSYFAILLNYSEFSFVNFTISLICPKATPTTVSAAP